MKAKILYFMGAGASAEVRPVVNNLGIAMVEMAECLLKTMKGFVPKKALIGY